MKILTFQVGVLQSNCHAVINGDSALLIDMGGDYGAVKSQLKKLGVTPKAVLLTHGHADHIMGAITAQTEVPIFVFASEAEFLSNPKLNLAPHLGLAFENGIKNPTLLSEGQVDICGFSVKVIHTPGHTSGSCCFLIENDLFTGDTIFCGSFGRFDLPSGNFAQLVNSVTTLLSTLDDDVNIYCGHGENTTVGVEKRTNAIYSYVKNN